MLDRSWGGREREEGEREAKEGSELESREGNSFHMTITVSLMINIVSLMTNINNIHHPFKI